jgi:CelD/BcsL family acetyltransferase involved in cellulose biosynthesis
MWQQNHSVSLPLSTAQHPVISMTTTQDWIIQAYDDLEAVQALWKSLVHVTPAAGPLATWEYASTWHRYLGSLWSPYILVVTRKTGDNSQHILLPLMRQGHKLCWFASPGLDNVSLLYDCPDHLSDGLAAIGNHLRQHWWDKLSLTYLPDEQANIVQKSLGFYCRAEANAGSPYIETTGQTWQEYFASRPKTLREEIQRAQRKLDRDQLMIRFETLTGSKQICKHFADIDAISANSNMAIKRSVMSGQQGKFLQELCLHYASHGWLALHMAYINDQPAAYAICLTVNGVMSSWRTAFDQNFRRYAPGKLLLAYEIQTCFEQGFRVYDFMHGLEPYKFSWTDQVQPLTYVIFYRSPLRGYVTKWYASARTRFSKYAEAARHSKS